MNMKKNITLTIALVISILGYSQTTKPSTAPKTPVKSNTPNKGEIGNNNYKLGDTVYVNENGVFIKFPTAVDLVSFGMDGEFKGTFKDKTVRLTPIAKEDKSRPVTVPLFIQYGGEEGNTLTKYVSYKKNVPTAFIDLTKDPDVNISAEEKKRREEAERLKKENERVKKRLDEIIPIPEEIRTVGIKQGNLFFAFTNIRIDDSYSYLKFYVQNNSNIPFRIDYVRFQNLDKIGAKSSDVSIDNKDSDIDPFIFSDLSEIPKQQKQYLTYALPLTGSSDKGGYKVTLKEKGGNRLLQITIPAKYIDKAKVIY